MRVITLPANQGQIVITVFIKKSEMPYEQREQAIAEIARSVRARLSRSYLLRAVNG